MIYREDYDNAQDYVNAKIRARRRKIRLTILVRRLRLGAQRGSLA